MEAESSVLGKMWDTLCLRNMDIEERKEMGILICNTTADQYTVTRGTWYIDSSSSRYIACNNYVDKNNMTKCQLVSAYTVIEVLNLKPTLLRVHEGVLMEDNNQKESLLHPYQAMVHQCRFNLTPMEYLDANEVPGEPKIIVEDMEIPFLFYRRKVY